MTLSETLMGETITYSNISLRPRLHEYVFIEKDLVFNEKAKMVLHLHIVFVSFSYRFSHLHENDEND